jgi:hypothetical protein
VFLKSSEPGVLILPVLIGWIHFRMFRNRPAKYVLLFSLWQQVFDVVY